MFYYIDIKGDKITGKQESTAELETNEDFREVTFNLYKEIGHVPCSFSEENGAVTWIEYIKPTEEVKPPTETELLGRQLVQKDLQIMALEKELDAVGKKIVSFDLRMMKGGF